MRPALIIATAIIADFCLEHNLRLSHIDGMNAEANAIIDHLGGTTAVAKAIEAPVSTVHSWRKIGIPSSRMAHLRLLAQVVGKSIDDAKSSIPATATPSEAA